MGKIPGFSSFVFFSWLEEHFLGRWDVGELHIHIIHGPSKCSFYRGYFGGALFTLRMVDICSISSSMFFLAGHILILALYWNWYPCEVGASV